MSLLLVIYLSMSAMRFSFSFWRDLLASVGSLPVPVEEASSPGFPIHPSASELAEEMLVDPEVLKNETYEPGIYDEDGDYYPQYSDDPSRLPEYIAPKPLDAGGDTVPESSPASDDTSSSDVPSPETKED